jgi:hypothetical protein
MAILEFNAGDLESLAGKISETQDLSEQERMLLVAIFAAAANQAAVNQDTQPPKDVAVLPVPEFPGQEPGAGALLGQEVDAAQLKEQLLNGYVPGKALRHSTHNEFKVIGDRRI